MLILVLDKLVQSKLGKVRLEKVKTAVDRIRPHFTYWYSSINDENIYILIICKYLVLVFYVTRDIPLKCPQGTESDGKILYFANFWSNKATEIQICSWKKYVFKDASITDIYEFSNSYPRIFIIIRMIFFSLAYSIFWIIKSVEMFKIQAYVFLISKNHISRNFKYF
jgi:hypothetical protein